MPRSTALRRTCQLSRRSGAARLSHNFPGVPHRLRQSAKTRERGVSRLWKRGGKALHTRNHMARILEHMFGITMARFARSHLGSAPRQRGKGGPALMLDAEQKQDE